MPRTMVRLSAGRLSFSEGEQVCINNTTSSYTTSAALPFNNRPLLPPPTNDLLYNSSNRPLLHPAAYMCKL
jgi:hypothetical protein